MQPSRVSVLSFRVAGYLLLALVAMLLPAVGEYRFWLAAVLTFIAVPVAIGLHFSGLASEREWADPLLDLLLTVGLVHLVPDVWVAALCVGLLVSLAPSISLHERSYLIYGINAMILVSGMALAGWIHDVTDWWLPILAVMVIYPSVIYYAHWQVKQADVLRERAGLMQHMHQLAGSITHEFNNALTIISGHVELARDGLETSRMDMRDARRDLDDAVNGVERAKLLCNQLLAFSLHHQEGQQLLDLETELTSLTHLLQSVIPPETRLNFSSETPSVSTVGNRAQLQQVLMNLILDAVQAVTHLPESQVEVRLSRVEIGERYWCEVVVQGPRSTATDLRTHLEKNIGLGLEKGKVSLGRIVRAHDGTLSVDDEREPVPSVTLRLPLAPTRTALPKSMPQVDTGASGGTVLVIDDEYHVRQVALRMLTDASFEVVGAASADEGLSFFRRSLEVVDVVVLDLKMPGKDGWTCLREMRALRADLPVVIVSGFDPDQSRRDTFSDPLVFVAKPFRRKELLDAVDLVKRKQRLGAEERSERVS